MSIFYAFCRVVDDVADSTELPIEEKRRQLGEWREEIRRAYLDTPLTPLGREMAQIIRTYLIAPTPLEEILNGMEMDMSITRYPNFALLEQYCYRVASAVGLVSIDIFGCRHPRTRDYAVALGMAFQLTNILRDVKKDASFGRIYLPLDELAAFGVTEADIMEGRWSERKDAAAVPLPASSRAPLFRQGAPADGAVATGRSSSPPRSCARFTRACSTKSSAAIST